MRLPHPALLCLLAALFFGPGPAAAQAPLFDLPAGDWPSLETKAAARWVLLAPESDSPEAALAQVQAQAFLPLPDSLPAEKGHVHWAYTRIHAPEAQRLYAYFGKAGQMRAFVLQGGQLGTGRDMGDFAPRSQLSVPMMPRSLRLDLAAGDTLGLLLRLENVTQSPPRLGFKLYRAEGFWEQIIFGPMRWQYFFQGALLLMLLYHLVLWLSVRERSYGFYLLYIALLSLSYLLHERLHYHLFPALAEQPFALHFVEIGSAQLAILSYYPFMYYLVRTRELVPRWHRITRAWLWLRLLSLPLLIWANAFVVPNDYLVYGAYMAEFLMLSLTSIVLLFKRDRVAHYFLAGTLLLGICGALSAADWLGLAQWPWAERIVQLGILMQLTLFSAGIGYKTRRAASLLFSLRQKNEDLLQKLETKVAEQESTLRLFSRYVPESVVHKALASSRQGIFDGENREVAVLFCDIRDFTALSEQLDAQGVVRLLNDFYSTMTRVVQRYGGSINQFIGDEILAVFGAPKATEYNERRAIFAALDMRKALDELNARHRDRLGRDIEIGIGINVGPVVSGNMGSEERMTYTIIGDTVNTAKRIEQLSKGRPNAILISEGVMNATTAFAIAKPLPEANVKGKAKALRIYELEGKR